MLKTMMPVLLLLSLVLVGVGCSPSATTFYYRMSAGPGEHGDVAFYEGPERKLTLERVPDREVRNVIYCIGDGMGFPHVALTRHYAGPAQTLWMDQLPVEGQLVTGAADKAITDSAAAGTAMACGVKTNNGMIGMTPDGTEYSTILELLDRKGWRTGLVVTAQISHATPACFSSHIVSRNKQIEIALQQVANRVDVMFGGGQKYWVGETYALAEKTGYTVIETPEQLRMLKTGPVVGLFAKDGMTTFDPEPSLAEMSHTAIQLLSSKSSEWFAPEPRFFLMIEGSQIDWAGHANDAGRVVRQTLLFDLAVREALDFAKRDGHTLVIVTSDHETGGLSLTVDPETGEIKTKWSTGGHTADNVPIYAYGPGAERFAGTLDNTDIPKRIAELTGIEAFPIQRSRVLETAGQK